MRKIIFLWLVVFTFIFNITIVKAAEYGIVKDITKSVGDSLVKGEGKIETKGDTTTISYSSSTFQMLAEDKTAADGQRPGPAAWIGFQITAPNSTSKFKVSKPDNEISEITTTKYQDFVGITPDNLKKALLSNTTLTYKYGFDWNEDGSYDQFVVIEIDPKGVTLLSNNDRSEVWSPEIAQNVLSENPNTSDINVFFLIMLMVVSGCGFVCVFKKIMA